MANPNPSPDTRFGAKNGNPIAGGKTKKQRKAEYAAAEKAAILRDKALSYIKDKIGKGEMTDEHLDLLLNPGTLKLFKDSEDRAHGTPKQSTEVSGAGGSPLSMALEVTTKIKDAD